MRRSSKLGDVQSMLAAIAKTAAQLCEANDAVILLVEGNQTRLGARYGRLGTYRAESTVLPLTHDSISHRAIVGRRMIHVRNLAKTPRTRFKDSRARVLALGIRTFLATPLLRDGVAIGSIAIRRTKVRPFTPKQIALLKTFADQAAIAIENARLSQALEARNADLTGALDRETATAEILRSISQAQADIQPVFETIAESAMRLFGAWSLAVFRYEDGFLRLAAMRGGLPGSGEMFRDQLQAPWRPSDDAPRDRAALSRAVQHVVDVDADPSMGQRFREQAKLRGFRSSLAVPMLRGEDVMGVIAITRKPAGGFAPAEIALLQTFADQAVIAIENARLLTELQAKNADLTEALNQQTATSEILQVISSSPTDLQPIFNAIASSAARLCDAAFSVVFRFDGEMISVAADDGRVPGTLDIIRSAYPSPPGRQSMSALAILERRVICMTDAQASEEYPHLAERARAIGYRSILVVPMLRGDAAIGAVNVARLDATPFTDTQIALLQTFADQAVIAIENVRLFTELGARNSELRAALEQQTATGEILRVISGSPTDEQPVFEAIVESAQRLCEATYSTLLLTDSGQIRVAAVRGMDEAGVTAMQQAYPRPIARDTTTGRSVLDRRLVHIADSALDPEYTHPLRVTIGLRSILSVPIFREGQPIGAISVWRPEPRPFTDTQIALLQTFADQAVIALENVRLFKELEARNSDLTEALEQQTATGEILRVISSSPTDVQPVFDTIVQSAVRLCDGLFSALFQFDGELIHQVAQHNFTPEAREEALRLYPVRPSRAHGSGRTILDRAVVHIPDVQIDPEYQHQGLARAVGFRSGLFVPMMREGSPIGVIMVARAAPGPFSESEIELLKTFADQAVIAIENVRLFKELEVRNRDLTVALEQQTATSEILRVISQSQTDVQPVFDTIVRSAVKLCDGLFSSLFRFDGELLHFVTQHNFTPEALEAQRRVFPARPNRGQGAARAILERAVVHMPDVEKDPEYQHQTVARAIGFRSGLYVPMLREGAPIGVIMVARAEAGPFSDNEIELLKTFADQAVIAVENVRLFKELQVRTGELTQSVEKLTALGDVSQALSSTLDVETVLDTIVSRASQLAGADGCVIYEYDEGTEQFHVRATHNLEPTFEDAIRRMSIRKGEGVGGRAAELRESVQVADMTQPGAYESSIRDVIIQAGYRAALAVPLLREDEVIGSLTLTRKTPGEFSPEIVETLKTFATQSALAIQNARLFREIADKSHQLEVASRHKSEFLANMSHELRTPLNAIIGFSEVLNERMFGELNDKQEEYLKDIHASGQHLLSLINDILDLSKIEAGRMELELTDFDLPMAIDNALTLVRERASRRGVTLTSTVGEHVGAIRGDERKIKQVLLNLLSNAIKFTPEGGRIEVGAAQVNGAVEVSVGDTGVGIAPEDLEAVFEEFKQVGASAAKQEGTGLGLALTRKFIELHGGTIRVESTLDVGSTFTFRLPVRT